MGTLSTAIKDRVTAEVTKRVTAEVTTEVTERVTAEVTEKVTSKLARNVSASMRAGGSSLKAIVQTMLAMGLPLEEAQRYAKGEVPDDDAHCTSDDELPAPIPWCRE